MYVKPATHKRLVFDHYTTMYVVTLPQRYWDMGQQGYSLAWCVLIFFDGAARMGMQWRGAWWGVAGVV